MRGAFHATRRLDAANVKSRFVIHAGFAKCECAGIRTSLFQNFRKLQKHYIFVRK
jgi:hypothetical protein